MAVTKVCFTPRSQMGSWRRSWLARFLPEDGSVVGDAPEQPQDAIFVYHGLPVPDQVVLLPELVNSKTSPPCRCWQMRAFPSFMTERFRPGCQAARSGWAFACSYSGSGARSMPPGQTIVPASRSTVTSAK
jgi:hypothetical protein